MATHTNQTPCPLTPKEREYIRRGLDIFFGTLPSWRTASSCGHGVVVRTPDSQKSHLHCRPWLTVA